MYASVGYRRVKHIRFDGTESECLYLRLERGFRLNPQLYEDFKDLASKNGYTVTQRLKSSWRTRSSLGLFSRQRKMQPLKPRRGPCLLGSKRASTGLTSETKLKQDKRSPFVAFRA